MSRRRRGRSVARFLGPAAPAFIAALALGGCGSTSHQMLPGNRIRGHRLTIYSSLPLVGPSAAGARTVLNGERLALAQAGGHVGSYGIELRPLDDATPQRLGWDPGQTTLNANLVLKDPTTIGYLGDLDSGATAVAIPLLNRVGIPAISPTSTAVGLTTDGPDAQPGEPAKYYPTGKRTFVRLSPDDALQARVQVRLQRNQGCTRTLVLDDGKFDGYDAATSFVLAARSARLHATGPVDFDPRATDYRSLLLGFVPIHPDCVLVSAAPESHAALLVTQIATVLPRARIFGTGALAQPGFTSPAEGGLAVSLDARMLLTVPAPARGTATRLFEAAYGTRFGPVGPYSFYGFEAMRLLLAAITAATEGGRQEPERSDVVSALMSAQVQASVLGPFTVDSTGATTLDVYNIDEVAGGELSRWRTVTAP